MDVVLIASTPQPVRIIYTACRTCYSKLNSSEIFKENVPEEAMLKLIDDVHSSGHHSVLEHVNFTFAINGISRVTSHQFVRHRHISLSQQSQRYVFLDDNKFKFIIPKEIDGELLDRYEEMMDGAHENYKELINHGISLENARRILPESSTTNIVATINLRELIHICGLRLCLRAQDEHREMVRRMVDEVVLHFPMFRKYLVPKCITLGYCPESKERTCGGKPLKEDLLETYNKVVRAGENVNDTERIK